MFTFGRDHEKKCAVRNLRNPAQAELILHVVDAVHDVRDGKATYESIRPILTRAFIAGGSGVWEQTGSWIRRIGREDSGLQSLWTELAAHSDSKIRFRVACFLNDLPSSVTIALRERLKNDRSRKVREMVVDRLEYSG